MSCAQIALPRKPLAPVTRTLNADLRFAGPQTVPTRYPARWRRHPDALFNQQVSFERISCVYTCLRTPSLSFFAMVREPVMRTYAGPPRFRSRLFGLAGLLCFIPAAHAERDLSGKTASGAYYSIRVPDGWKAGDTLVLFQHG